MQQPATVASAWQLRRRSVQPQQPNAQQQAAAHQQQEQQQPPRIDLEPAAAELTPAPDTTAPADEERNFFDAAEGWYQA
jgi:hypothetical protein